MFAKHSPTVRALGRHEGQANADDAPEHGEDDDWHDTHVGGAGNEDDGQTHKHKVDRRDETRRNSENTERRAARNRLGG